MKAIQVQKTGGPDALTLADIPAPSPKPSEVVVKIAVSGINFIDIYFYRYPVYQPEGFNFSRRVLSRFIDLELKKQQPVYLLTREPSTHFRTYLFFTNRYQRHDFDIVGKIYQQTNLDQIDYGNLHLTTHLDDNSIAPNATIIVETNFNSNRYPSQRQFSINHLANNLPIYRIFSPKSCLNISVSDPIKYSLGDLNIENMSESAFCQKFIKVII